VKTVEVTNLRKFSSSKISHYTVVDYMSANTGPKKSFETCQIWWKKKIKQNWTKHSLYHLLKR